MTLPTIVGMIPHCTDEEIAALVGDLLHAAKYVANERLPIPGAMLEDLRAVRDGELACLDETFRDAATDMIARLTQTN